MGKESFKERFRLFAAQQGLSVSELQERLNVSNAYIYNTSRMSPAVAVKLKKLYPSVNIDWINDGKGEMTFNPSEALPVHKVPLLPMSALAGSILDFGSTVVSYNCEKIVSPVDDARFALTITGDSMAPEYPNGCIVFVKRVDEFSFVEWGKTFVLDTPNGYIVKNIHPSSSEDKVTCRSVNQSYADFDVSTSYIRAWYKVVLVMVRK